MAEPIPGPIPSDRNLSGRAKELASDAGKELLDRANREGQRGMTALGEQLDNAAGYLARQANEVATKGAVPVTTEQVEAVAERVHSAAQYLKEHDPEGVVADIDKAIRKHPYRAIAVGLGLGWLIGRLSRD